MIKRRGLPIPMMKRGPRESAKLDSNEEKWTLKWVSRPRKRRRSTKRATRVLPVFPDKILRMEKLPGGTYRADDGSLWRPMCSADFVAGKDNVILYEGDDPGSEYCYLRLVRLEP